jgi:hypothetical protein
MPDGYACFTGGFVDELWYRYNIDEDKTKLIE